MTTLKIEHNLSVLIILYLLKNVSHMVSHKGLYSALSYLISMLMIFQTISKTIIVQYADDTQLLHTGNINNLQGLISDAQNTLTQTKKFFNRNGLLLNVKKKKKKNPQCIFIGSRNYISSIPDGIKPCLDECYIFPSKEFSRYQEGL